MNTSVHLERQDKEAHVPEQSLVSPESLRLQSEIANHRVIIDQVTTGSSSTANLDYCWWPAP